MSIAAAQASKFYEQAVHDERVFTFTSERSCLVFPMAEREVMPFWSSRSRMEIIQKQHPKYSNYSIIEIPLAKFLNETMPHLETDNLNVGVNWAGRRLTGYDIPVKDLRRNLVYWQEKRNKNG